MKQLSTEISGLLAESKNFIADDINTNGSDKNNNLIILLEQERNRKEEVIDRNIKLEAEVENLKLHIEREKLQYDIRLKEEAFKLKDQLESKTKAIEFLVSRNAELESNTNSLSNEISVLKQEKCSLEQSVENLGSACSEMRMQTQSEGKQSDEVNDYKELKEKEVQALKELLLEKEESYKELQGKLSQVTSAKDEAESKLRSMSSEFEMCKVHLMQMRGSGGHDLLNEKDSEIAVCNKELAQTRIYLSEATLRIEKLTLEQDMMTEQYRNYSRDLANQTEKMAEQMKKYKEENMRLTQRETSLVQHVGSLETQMQKFIKGGKNVTEEEICRLKHELLTSQTDLRFTTDEKEKLQQMFTDCNNQLDESSKKLSQKTGRITELEDKVLGLETTVEMLQSSSQKNCTDQAELLAACQSDKVAASMAMEQNLKLKERLDELNGAVVSLTNSKAEIMDKLEDSKQSLSQYVSIESKLSAMNEMVKEKDIMNNNLKNHIKYLEEQLRDINLVSVDNTTKYPDPFIDNHSEIKKELDHSKETIRCLNSQISELQSKLEVLSSQTRECSESRSSSRFSDGRTGMVDTDSDSCDSYIEVDSTKTPKDDSSESFIDLAQSTDIYNKVEDEETEKKDKTTNSHQSGCLDNIEALKHLEKRFISAMGQLAELSSEKEQLEYLVARLQEETETVGDYVIMYQHQRMQQKLKIQEKEDEVRQLAKDRSELQEKLNKLQGLVTNLVAGDSKDPVTEPVIEANTSESHLETEEKKKILDLLSEIDTDSNQIIARCEVTQPWFWENSQAKVMTV